MRKLTMKKQKKLSVGLVGILMTICILAGALSAHPVETEAASFKVYQAGNENFRTKAGKYYIWESGAIGNIGGISFINMPEYTGVLHISTTRNGKGKIIARTAKNHSIGYNILFDGSSIYYVDHGSTGSRIYRVNVNGKNKTYIAKVNDCGEFSGYYNGTAYLNCGSSQKESTYQLDTKTKKIKCIMKNLPVSAQYNRYLFLLPLDAAFFNSGKLYVYDCRKETKVKISSKACKANYVSGKIYYAEKISSKSVCIRSSSLNGKNKKTLVKKLSIYGGAGDSIGKITSKSVYYCKGQKYYRYNFKTKKSTKISQASYQY